MISKFLTVACLAGFAGSAIAEPVELVLDTQPLVDFDVPPFVASAGLRSIEYFPFGNPARIVIQTRLADLTCEFQDAMGVSVDPGSGASDFVIEIDRIPTAPGQSDPNVDADGQPIDREYPLDPASGKISQFFMPDVTALDICTSVAACVPQGDAAVQLVCREAGTRIFAGDFEPVSP